MSNKDDDKDDIENLEYKNAILIAQMIKNNISEITELVNSKIKEDDIFSLLSAYSALVAVTNYFEFKMRDNGIADSTIETSRIGAENYVLTLIGEELNTTIQKKGDA